MIAQGNALGHLPTPTSPERATQEVRRGHRCNSLLGSSSYWHFAGPRELQGHKNCYALTGLIALRFASQGDALGCHAQAFQADKLIPFTVTISVPNTIAHLPS
jgi:hypothetical protein